MVSPALIGACGRVGRASGRTVPFSEIGPATCLSLEMERPRGNRSVIHDRLPRECGHLRSPRLAAQPMPSPTRLAPAPVRCRFSLARGTKTSVGLNGTVIQSTLGLSPHVSSVFGQSSAPDQCGCSGAPAAQKHVNGSLRSPLRKYRHPCPAPVQRMLSDTRRPRPSSSPALP